MEKKYDSQFKVVFDAVRQVMKPDEPKKKSIGFRRQPDQWIYLRVRQIPQCKDWNAHTERPKDTSSSRKRSFYGCRRDD